MNGKDCSGSVEANPCRDIFFQVRNINDNIPNFEEKQSKISIEEVSMKLNIIIIVYSIIVGNIHVRLVIK